MRQHLPLNLKPRKIALKIFCVGFALFSLFLAGSLCFFNLSSYPVSTGSQLLATATVLLVIAGVTALTIYLFRRVKFLRRLLLKPWAVAGLFFLVLVPLQFTIVQGISAPIGWDPGWIMEAVLTTDAPYGRLDYFYAYPNNALLLFYQRALLGLTGAFGAANPWLAFSFYGMLHINAAILFAFAFALNCGGSKTGYATLLFCGLLFGLSPWLVVPYSDVFAMPYIAAALWAYARWKTSSRRGHAVLYALLCGAFFGIGGMIKPHTLILAIAICILQVFTMTRRELRKVLSGFAAAAAIALCLNGVFQVFLQNQNLILLDSQRVFPPEHFVNMGLTLNMNEGAHGYYGGYSPNDVGLIQSALTQAEMAPIIRQSIKEKLSNYGLPGYFSFLINKVRWFTSEGYFYWGLEGGGPDTFAQFNNAKPNFWAQLFYPGGGNYQIWIYAAQGVWAAMLIFIAAAAVLNAFRQQQYSVLLQIAIFGMCCFLMLFEARSRYLICFLPLFALLAATAHTRLFEGLQKLHFPRITNNSLA